VEFVPLYQSWASSFESFNQRFAIPIEKFQDKQVRSKLKTHSTIPVAAHENQVLEELPSVPKFCCMWS